MPAEAAASKRRNARRPEPPPRAGAFRRMPRREIREVIAMSARLAAEAAAQAVAAAHCAATGRTAAFAALEQVGSVQYGTYRCE
jgi:hypothetical protein